MSTWRAPTTAEAGALALTAAVLLPAALRHVFCHACRDVEAYVSVHLAVPAPEAIVCYAVDAADRQHQRQGWTERCRANALLPNDQARIRFAVGHDAGRLPEILALPKPAPVPTASPISASPLPGSAISSTSLSDPC